jgi:pyruvate-ferredoxin/flavodoxin oxidoreductase
MLLMVPNMFKIAGELTPAVVHVAARAVATHALSIFGDHSDVMAVRSTGWAMLAASSVQEAHDFALVAHAATLRTRVPFLHFFDGFRTSHEIDKIALLDDDDLRALVSEEFVLAHRARGLTPDRPLLRGSAQNPDVFFQAREAANPFYDAVPGVVEGVMGELGARTGRHYHLLDYTGHPSAERVLVVMGSVAGAAAETVDELARRGERVGLLTVRLYRPFSATALAATLPQAARAVAVLDRTKEPGAPGEPLYLDVVGALQEQARTVDRVLGVRYGLASKEVTPAMLKGVFDELSAPCGRHHVTIGIRDDVTQLSVAADPSFTVPVHATQAVFFGLGSDGTVGANKSSIKIIGEGTDDDVQGYFVIDSRKEGSVTVSHLRFGPGPIRSTYLVDGADFVACHQFGLLARMKVLDVARPGATFLLNSPYSARDVWRHLPHEVQQQIVDKRLRVFVVDAHALAREIGLGERINTVMQPCFFALAGLEHLIPQIKHAVEATYGKRGSAVVERNFAAVDRALENLAEVQVPETPTNGHAPVHALADSAPDFVRRVTARLIAGEGDLLPVSALPVDGAFPTGTARWEKRAIAQDMPMWDPDLCTDCGKCAVVCPHSAIRLKA